MCVCVCVCLHLIIIHSLLTFNEPITAALTNTTSLTFFLIGQRQTGRQSVGVSRRLNSQFSAQTVQEIKQFKTNKHTHT